MYRMYGHQSSNWAKIKPALYFVVGIVPNIVIFATTIPTLKCLFDARKTARRVQGSDSWQGALTVVLISAVYCISTLPYMIYQFSEGIIIKNPPGLFHVY